MNEVSQWLQSGAEVREGLRLLSIYAPNRHLEALVSRNPERFKDLLKKTLSRFADTTMDSNCGIGWELSIPT